MVNGMQGPIRVVVGKPVEVGKLPPGVDVRSEEGHKCAQWLWYIIMH